MDRQLGYRVTQQLYSTRYGLISMVPNNRTISPIYTKPPGPKSNREHPEAKQDSLNLQPEN